MHLDVIALVLIAIGAWAQRPSAEYDALIVEIYAAIGESLTFHFCAQDAIRRTQCALASPRMSRALPLTAARINIAHALQLSSPRLQRTSGPPTPTQIPHTTFQVAARSIIYRHHIDLRRHAPRSTS